MTDTLAPVKMRTASWTPLAMCLALSSCKSDERSPDGVAGTRSAEAPDSKGVDDERAAASAGASEVAAAVLGVMPDEAVRLESLLDAVPDGVEAFVAVRDAGTLLDVFDATVAVSAPTVLQRFRDRPETADVRAAIENVSKFRDALIEAKVDIDGGMIFLEEDEVLVYRMGADDPAAINVALRAVGVDPSELPPTCVQPEAMPGFAACGDDEPALRALAPGKRGAALALEFGDALAGFDMEKTNVVFRLRAPQDRVVLGSIATPAARVHMALSLASLAPELGGYMDAKRPAALGLRGRGAAFVWGSVQLDAFADAIAQAPLPARNVAGTLTGEVMLGGVEGSAGAALVGVQDPFPASGLVSMAALQADAVKEQLPPGSKIEVRPIELGGETIQVLHAEFGVDGPGRGMLDALKIVPQAWLFSAGQYAGVVLGGDQAAVTTVAGYEAGRSNAGDLPSNLATALDGDDTAFAIHLPFDALQSAVVRSTFLAAFEQVPEAEALDPALVAAAYDLTSPLSSLSIWLTHPDDHRVLHLSLEGFGDVTTDEGKAALAAVGEVIAGADPSATYGALATTYGSTKRASRYRLRAGEGDDVGRAAMSTSFLMGVAAGVMVPAFQQYVERSRAAQAELSAAQRALMQAGEALE